MPKITDSKINTAADAGEILYGLYLTVGKISDGRTLAMVTDGHARLGHTDVTVLTVTPVRNMTEAKEWFKKVRVERPWVTRQ